MKERIASIELPIDRYDKEILQVEVLSETGKISKSFILELADSDVEVVLYQIGENLPTLDSVSKDLYEIKKRIDELEAKRVFHYPVCIQPDLRHFDITFTTAGSGQF